jgi:hypothetical protein
LRGEVARSYLGRALAFSEAAHELLGAHEDAGKSRVSLLERSYESIGRLEVRQDDLFRQALRCAEHELFRAAHVMAWAGLMDFLEEQLSQQFAKIRELRPAWRGETIEAMREYVAESQLIDVMQPLGLCTKNQVKALHGLLNRRNECAHPSAYFPGLNETLGYISEVLQRLRQLQAH